MSIRKFLLDPRVYCGWDELIWAQYTPPSKIMILWKKFHGRLFTDQHIQHVGLHICSMCTLCEKQQESIQNTYFFLMSSCFAYLELDFTNFH